MKKIRIPSEIIYLSAITLLSLAVAILTSADFGVSMIVAPAYLLSLKTEVLSFGQAEYVIQAGVFILLCAILKKFRPIYLFSFATCLIYGFALDLWRLMPCFNPSVTPAGSMALHVRIIMFVVGVLLTSFSVALFFKTYIYPQVYDFFVKAVSTKYRLNLSVFKTAVDMTLLTASVIMTFSFFGEFRGIGWGTPVMAVVNGTIIGLFSKLLDKIIIVTPAFGKFASLFDLSRDVPEIPADPNTSENGTANGASKDSVAGATENGNDKAEDCSANAVGAVTENFTDNAINE